MSLIADALKTAQRERERRASHEGPSAAAVLVPLTRRGPRFSAGPRGALVVLAVVVGGGSVAVIVRDRASDMDSTPASAAATRALLSEAVAASPPLSTPGRTTGARGDRTGSPPIAPGVPPYGQRAERQAATVTPVTPSATESLVLQQGSADSADVAAVSQQADAQGGQLSVAVAREPSTARLFSRAVAAHRAGDIAGARALYEQVLAGEPEHSDALNNLGVIASAGGDVDTALTFFRRAAALAPRNAAVWNNMGTALREHGNSPDAIAAFRQALAVDPRHQGAQIGLAQGYLAIGSLGEARELLERVLARDATVAEAHYTLGQVLERQGDRPGAIAAYTTFVSVAPPHLTTHADRVRQYIRSLSR